MLVRGRPRSDIRSPSASARGLLSLNALDYRSSIFKYLRLESVALPKSINSFFDRAGFCFTVRIGLQFFQPFHYRKGFLLTTIDFLLDLSNAIFNIFPLRTACGGSTGRWRARRRGTAGAVVNFSCPSSLPAGAVTALSFAYVLILLAEESTPLVVAGGVFDDLMITAAAEPASLDSLLGFTVETPAAAGAAEAAAASAPADDASASRAGSTGN